MSFYDPQICYICLFEIACLFETSRLLLLSIDEISKMKVEEENRIAHDYLYLHIFQATRLFDLHVYLLR